MTAQSEEGPSPSLRVTLFVTCLADLFRPEVGFASIKLLERAACTVTVPLSQTCCGQPAYNSGDYEAAVPLAQRVVAMLEPAEFIVVPSGSCAGMIRRHYPTLLQGDWRERARAVADRTFELTTFLHDIARIPASATPAAGTDAVAYHDSCAGLRELGIREQPRQLLRELCGIESRELQQRDACCGFGGTFCAKMPRISAKMVDDKLGDILASGARVVTGGDLGCLLNIAGRATRRGEDIEVRHVAELLCGDTSGPAIGERD